MGHNKFFIRMDMAIIFWDTFYVCLIAGCVLHMFFGFFVFVMTLYLSSILNDLDVLCFLSWYAEENFLPHTEEPILKLQTCTRDLVELEYLLGYLLG